TVTATVNSFPERSITVAIAAPYISLTEAYSILVETTSWQGRTLPVFWPAFGVAPIAASQGHAPVGNP
ncbi:MAG: hypothetical protein WBG92_13065, partial [Thiohalocapsa sp.]